MSDATTPLTGWDNPFLRNMPMVAIVRQTVVKNGETIVSDETKSKRVFFRVPNNRVVPAPVGDIEIMPSHDSRDKLHGFDNLKPFTP